MSERLSVNAAASIVANTGWSSRYFSRRKRPCKASAVEAALNASKLSAIAVSWLPESGPACPLAGTLDSPLTNAVTACQSTNRMNGGFTGCKIVQVCIRPHIRHEGKVPKRKTCGCLSDKSFLPSGLWMREPSSCDILAMVSSLTATHETRTT